MGNLALLILIDVGRVISSLFYDNFSGEKVDQIK